MLRKPNISETVELQYTNTFGPNQLQQELKYL